MTEVTVKVEDLRAKVQANRDAHREVFERADAGWKQAALDWFNVQAERAVAGEEFAVWFNETRPEDHTADYDTVLDMLDMEVGEEVTLTMQEFRQYARDDWGWKKDWTATASNYTNV